MGEPKASGKREPLTEVIVGEDVVQVLVELPGVDKEDIDLQVSSSAMGILCHSERCNYEKTLDLPADVDRETAKASYRNGVLEVTLRKVEKKPHARRTIRIE